MPPVDKAGRQIAGLLTYNPGPGIYSRLERAIEAMPENVRVQELPGLLKRYKDGVPGWELKATDLDSVIAGRDLVPRDELLGAVRERSPVYTHGEVVLGGRPQVQHVPTGGSNYRYDSATDTTVRLPDPTRPVPDYQNPDTGDVSRIGMGVSHGEPKYREYGQGGEDYTELLLHQPGQTLPDYGSHWDSDTKNAVAHARYDTHGDALRINELQSDLGIHNRKAREEAGYDSIDGSEPPKELPFPMEDAWADLLIKRMALEAARKGHRAIEVASPRAIADKVGGNIDNYEHFYGKVVPGALERLGRRMGGLAEDSGPASVSRDLTRPEWAGRPEIRETIRSAPTSMGEDFAGGPFWKNYSEMMHANLGPLDSDRVYQEFGGYGNYGRTQEQAAGDMYSRLSSLGYSPQEAQAITSRALFEAPHAASIQANYVNQKAIGTPQPESSKIGRRYLMSDEMRRRLIQEGVGAAVAGGILSQDDLIERLRQ